jgi:uncharacterized radical SAM superfamily protein
MSEYQIETRSTSPKNFFAGDFPTVPETGTAGAKIAEYTPVTKDESGKIVAITKDTLANVIGITAAAAGNEEPVVYYMTGEFHADAINVPDGTTIEEIKDACRKISIFLK